MKQAPERDSAPAEKARRPWVSCHLQGTQAQCAELVRGIARVFGPDAIADYGHIFPRPRHGPGHVSVHLRVTPGPRPRRPLRLPRLRRRRPPDVPAPMIPVKAAIGGKPVAIGKQDAGAAGELARP